MYKIGAGIGPATSFLFRPGDQYRRYLHLRSHVGRIGWARSLSAVILAFGVDW